MCRVGGGRTRHFQRINCKKTIELELATTDSSKVPAPPHPPTTVATGLAAMGLAAADAAGGPSMQISMQFLLQLVKGFFTDGGWSRTQQSTIWDRRCDISFFAILITICNHCIGNSQQQNAKPTAPWPSPQPHHQHKAKVQQKTKQ